MDKKAKKAALEKAYEAAWAQSKNLQAKTDADKQNLESEKNAWIKLKSEQHEELLKKEATLEKEIALLKIELSNLDKNYEKSKSETSSDDLLKKEIALTNEKSKVHILAKKLELEKANADKNLKETKDLAEKISSMEQIILLFLILEKTGLIENLCISNAMNLVFYFSPIKLLFLQTMNLTILKMKF
jgi:hypothetical protein